MRFVSVQVYMLVYTPLYMNLLNTFIFIDTEFIKKKNV